MVVAAASNAAARPSNPAFLGVGMTNTGAPGIAGPCEINTVTPGGSASAAGLRQGDKFLSIDGTSIPSCDALITFIQEREPGQQVKIDVLRNGNRISVKAELLSRTELLRRRFVGQILPAADVIRYDDRSDVDLGTRGKTTIVGWFDPRCVGCSTTFAQIDRWTRRTGKHVRVFAATKPPITDNLDELKPLAKTLDVPLLVADADTFKQFSIEDIDRLHFMVIDCRGIVSYVATIAPDAEDLDATLDELYAAAEQATRRMK